MLSFLPGPVLGVLASLLLAINTVFWCTLLYIPAVLKLIIPLKPWRVLCTRVIILISEAWVGCNTAWMRLTQKTEWEVEGLEHVKKEGWYLVLSNHQSWVDIFALQHVLNRKAPFLKFFLKQELIWVPVIGLAWWGLDFPFMKRYSKAYLEKHPEKKGQDMETTRKACEKFKTTPVSVMNFVEGTRFTRAKHDRQGSPYKNLLKPRAGGTAFTLDAMGDAISTLLDVTIVYPGGAPTLWDFMCGRVSKIHMLIQNIPIPETLVQGDYANDPHYREHIQSWINDRWEQKDALIDRLLEAERATA
ncbi:acyltransferase [Marinobacteraceae bacterium S3BR75-40.1]